MTRTLVRTALFAVALVSVLGTSSAFAGGRHYRHDAHGWYDKGGHRHDYVVRNGHHGYWDNHIWISID